VHRDLKADNVMVVSAGDINSEDTNFKLEIKLIDFGFAKLVEPNESLNEFLGTPYYIAPEIINKAPYSNKCDIWALGVLTYLLICGSHPFEADSRD
jgi:serine/threonine protein kinase